ncbi:BLUF domain-containing protein [Sphingomonas sp. S2-65]|uniref:BLUF domain-containing protein n=1 Tax=Sphingomonas sp. S2-65 TaxID=2903960 RepID=UPI001F47EA7B|nr:BLUF domain-containing protein [Sphingomonas sp. S2-65]UYY58641.1 BLUF domain-containing protein [Sphingomonas sp. S2-65]
MTMLQLIYVSSVRPGAEGIDPDTILAKSRVNNQRDEITGLLYSDGTRFLQALEGPTDKVEAAYARIKADPRHRAIVMLSEREIQAREFGEWAMAHKTPSTDADEFIGRVSDLSANASPNVRATFESFAQVRRAA